MSGKLTRRNFLAATAIAPFSSSLGRAQEPQPTPGYPENVSSYLSRLYSEHRRQFSFQGDDPGRFAQWQQDARPALRELIGLKNIASQVGKHDQIVHVDDETNADGYTRRKGWIETEPDVRIPFWLLKPKGAGPFPLALLPHGHDKIGHDTYAGVFHDEDHKQQTLANDRSVAVQAVSRGFLAIAPATRGLGVDGVPDLTGRHGERDCRSQLMHCLLAGRTAIGERVWDLSRLLDWATTLPEVDSRQTLMMGNSGGGMATLYTAACDERITIAVPSCSFTTITSPEGRIYHCDCNMVPGLLTWGDLYDVAGLIAPRWLLAVNGRRDKLHRAASIERAAARARMIYKAAGHPTRFEHRWGPEGHRFYSDLMWPFVMQAVQEPASQHKS